jgi:hypothetical protein
MKSSLIRATFLCIILLVGVSCQRDLPQTPAFTEFNPYNTDEEIMVMPQNQDSLAADWTASDHSDWDEITGEIDPAVGGTISGTPATWPSGYSFTISVPANALPQDVTELSIYIPKNLDPLSNTMPPAVYKLEPDIECLNDQVISVTICYPPWLDSANGYEVYCIYQTGGTPAYGSSDLQDVVPVGPDKRKAITFTTSHFSRWKVAGKPGV